MFDNIILEGDSYKGSHFGVFPPGTSRMHYYIESRGGLFDKTVVFGRQAYLKTYLTRPITRANIEEAKDFFGPHGEPFNEEGWNHILNKHGGYLPLEIRGVPEGTVLPTHNVMTTVENTDPAAFWLPGYIETSLLRGIWYPTTVATLSWHAKQVIRSFLDKTSDDPETAIQFALHDFGARGVSSGESAALGGMAHLVNFRGSDTMEGIIAARRFYGEPMAGFSIPAAEHSTITSWGRAREPEAYRHHLQTWSKTHKMFAVVSDSYDLWNAIQNIWGGELKAEVLASGARLVVRPDSGHPPTVVLKAVQMLDAAFGSTVNSKDYRVLHPSVRVIQGDGINLDMIGEILTVLTAAGYSAENVAFGMGGALLQGVNRDTQRFAMKASAIEIGGVWTGFNKCPVDDPGKASKAGRLALISEGNGYETVPLEGNHWRNLLVPNYRNGQMLNETTYAEVRERAANPLVVPVKAAA